MIICVPKLKRHNEAIVTVSLKNMMGIIPDDEKGKFHVLGLHQCIADLNSVFKPDLIVVDATRVMTKSGPGLGTMVQGDMILASGDPVAVDFLSAIQLFKLEGYEEAVSIKTAANVPHIKSAADMGIGTIDIDKIKLLERKLQ